MSRPCRLAVLVSGEGTNLQALLDDLRGVEDIEIACVASSRASARGLARARAAGVDSASFEAAGYPTREERDRALAGWLATRSVELVVLAGFMELLSTAFVARFRGAILNVHPSLLPAFPGTRAIERAIEHGVRVTGVTVHFVDEGVDTGPIVAQEAFGLPYAPDIAEVERRVHEIEHRLLPWAVRQVARGAVRLDPEGPRRLILAEGDAGD